MASFPKIFQSTSLTYFFILLNNNISKTIETMRRNEVIKLNKYILSSPRLLTYKPKEYLFTAWIIIRGMVQAKISARYIISNILNILGSYDKSLIDPVMLVIETIRL